MQVRASGSNVWWREDEVEEAEPLTAEDEPTEPPARSRSRSKLDDVDLAGLTDAELLGHLDEVSEELKRRNGLLPKTGSSAMVDVLKAVRDLTRG